MEKFIPYEKLSKKKQRELNAMKRGSWGSFNPVTRKPANPKAYNRKAAQRWKDGYAPFMRDSEKTVHHEGSFSMHKCKVKGGENRSDKSKSDRGAGFLRVVSSGY